LAATAAPVPGQAQAATGLSLNEDNSHYFFSRAGRKLSSENVASFIDQYAGTQVRELMFSPNSQRTSFGSKASSSPASKKRRVARGGSILVLVQASQTKT